MIFMSQVKDQQLQNGWIQAPQTIHDNPVVLGSSSGIAKPPWSLPRTICRLWMVMVMLHQIDQDLWGLWCRSPHIGVCSSMVSRQQCELVDPGWCDMAFQHSCDRTISKGLFWGILVYTIFNTPKHQWEFQDPEFWRYLPYIKAYVRPM